MLAAAMVLIWLGAFLVKAREAYMTPAVFVWVGLCGVVLVLAMMALTSRRCSRAMPIAGIVLSLIAALGYLVMFTIVNITLG